MRRRPPPGEWASIVEEITGPFTDVFAAHRAIDRHFPGSELSLAALLPGSRERVLAAVLADAIAAAATPATRARPRHRRTSSAWPARSGWRSAERLNK